MTTVQGIHILWIAITIVHLILYGIVYYHAYTLIKYYYYAQHVLFSLFLFLLTFVLFYVRELPLPISIIFLIFVYISNLCAVLSYALFLSHVFQLHNSKSFKTLKIVFILLFSLYVIALVAFNLTKASYPLLISNLLFVSTAITLLAYTVCKYGVIDSVTTWLILGGATIYIVGGVLANLFTLPYFHSWFNSKQILIYIYGTSFILELHFNLIGLLILFIKDVKQKILLSSEKLELERQQSSMYKLMIERDLRLLRSQLNPHFIHNAFSTLAINLNYQTKKKENIDYLKKLSTYFRRLLEISNINVHPLEDELEFTLEFLTIQQTLSSGKFHFELIIPDQLDTHSIIVPTMFLQPLVENCIIHGFKNFKLNKMCKIVLSVFTENETLVIKIEDNGIGLVNELNLTKGNSFGQSSVFTMLKLLYPEVSCCLMNNLNKPGAAVVIRIPIDC